MELVNDFTVNVPVEEAWHTLTDVERIAPCLPGAQLQEVDGDTYRGVVKVKVGPILAQFKGQAAFVEKDDVNHRAVLKAEGRDTGGKGNASALITAQLTSKGEGTTYVQVSTDLTITGKVAQFGRGAMADVSNKLLGQFVENLETTVLAKPAPATEPAAAPTATAPAAAANGTGASAAPEQPTVRRIDHPEPAPLDLAEVAGGAILKRLLPLVGVVALVLFLLMRRRRR
jgi:carbon monoxide dehydrogenase subunit G